MNEYRQIIQAYLEKATSIAITTHVNPDGDGYCAALALQRILNSLGYPSIIWTDNDDFSRYLFLDDGIATITKVYDPTAKHDAGDLVFVLDCNSYDRVGARRSILDNANTSVMIDHHMLENNPIEADVSFVDSAYVSAGAMVYEVFKEDIIAMSVTNSLYVGNCLYTTILNDTNNYANANTNAAVFRFAADLAELGIKPNVLYKEFFLNHSAEEMRYVGQTLATIELHYNRRILTMFSTLQMSIENNIDPESVMNITRWVQGVIGLDAICYIREEAGRMHKISLRSPKHNVNAVAARYGGGGHKLASGCTIAGELPEIKNMLVNDIIEAIGHQ